MTLTDPVERGELIGAFRASVTTETAKGRTTFAEVEESEADRARFETCVAEIKARDYFAAPIGTEVRAELDPARQAMKRFEAAALAAETTAGSTGRAAVRLRAVESHRP
ncbi:Chromate resistance protein ChrB [Streptomyces sp. KHY 26]|uniref:Chromate resistance protein ChrB n=1 Tax=Streptomyces sp. KHY 26 TaxID=3097359 RepID=UPI00376EFEEB